MVHRPCDNERRRPPNRALAALTRFTCQKQSWIEVALVQLVTATQELWLYNPASQIKQHLTTLATSGEISRYQPSRVLWGIPYR